MSNALTLSVNTGAVEVIVMDGKEEIGTFKFIPTDLDIVTRYETVIKEIEELSIEESTDGFFKMTDELKRKFDYLLNANASEGLFSKCNPLTPTTNGDFFFETVLEQIGALIEKQMDARIAKKKAKIERAVSKYHK